MQFHTHLIFLEEDKMLSAILERYINLCRRNQNVNMNKVMEFDINEEKRYSKNIIFL